VHLLVAPLLLLLLFFFLLPFWPQIRDVTPEAVSPLLEKLAPGIVHAMMRESLNILPQAMLARPVAGIRSKT
jgi:molybdopterin biosynthesis enzyme MoaB